MDIRVSASIDVNNCHGKDVIKSLNIQDEKNGILGSNPPQGKYDKYFSNPTTFPTSMKTTSSVEASLEHTTCKEYTPCDNPKSIPVSAMKGSREKRGVTPPEKLTVKWAPEVYDPVPTSVSHTVTKNKSQKQNKKNSKSKHKSSRGSSKYRDKKQGRKHGGTSSAKKFKPPEQEEEEVVVVGDYGLPLPPPTTMEFHVGNQDQFCGTSFLKGYDTNSECFSSF